MAIEEIPPAQKPRQKIVLLVEDEEPIRLLSELILARGGYAVITARDGIEALEKLRVLDEPIDLLITDLAMPKLSGDDLAIQALALRPTLRVMFASGSFGQTGFQGMSRVNGAHKLIKPYTPAQLLQAVNQIT